MLGIQSNGDFKKTIQYLKNLKDKPIKFDYDNYGRMGVRALKSNTPKDTGKTASSWNYRVVRKKEKTTIEWYNTNVVDEVEVVILIQYDHITGTGGFVQGYDFINPAMRPLFNKMVSDYGGKGVKM